VTLYWSNEALHRVNEPLNQYNESLHLYNEALQRFRASALPALPAEGRRLTARRSRGYFANMRSVALKEIPAMTKVAILPVSTEQGALSYHAVAGAKHAEGNTGWTGFGCYRGSIVRGRNEHLFIVQLRPDRFFTAAQQERLADLMARWRTARDEATPCRWTSRSSWRRSLRRSCAHRRPVLRHSLMP